MTVEATEQELNLIKVVVTSILLQAQTDGWKWADLPAFLKSPNFGQAVVQAVAAAPKVPGELTDLSLLDDIELGKYVYGMVTEILADLKKVKK